MGLAISSYFWAFGLQMSCGLSLVLRLCFFASFRSSLFAFIETAGLRPIFLRNACAPIVTHSYFTTVGILLCFSGIVAFPEYFCTPSRGQHNGCSDREDQHQTRSFPRTSELDYGSMPECDGKSQGQDVPKQACSCWFVRHC